MLKRLSPAVAYLAVGAGMFIFQNAWAALLGYHAGIVLILISVRPSVPLSTLFKSKGFWRALGVILVCGSSGVALYYLWPVFGVIPTLPANLASFGLTPAVWPVFITYFTLVNPWLEEYFWRGYLGSESKQLILNDILFAGFHVLVLLNRTSMPSILFALLVLTFAGWMWRQVARLSGGLLTNVLAHMAADFTILFAVYQICLTS